MSISSNILSNLTSFRNPNGPEQEWTRAAHRNPANPLRVVAAEVGYIATIPFAIVETAIAAIAKLFSACLPISQGNHDKMTAWLKSSAFSIAWSSADAAINLFCNDMIQTESVARACAASGNILAVPMSAL
ncbi:MAG: hypothetical protein Tsb0015_16720 [Simkaniaceae bacterium]